MLKDIEHIKLSAYEVRKFRERGSFPFSVFLSINGEVYCYRHDYLRYFP